MLATILAAVALFGDGRATLVGYVTIGGEPAAGAKLWLYRRSLSRGRTSVNGKPFDETSFYCSNERGEFDPYWLANPAAKLTLPSDGRFAIDGLKPHHYRLVIETERGHRLSIDPLTIQRNVERVDLGDVELERACRIEGRVLLPEGASGEGWSVESTYLFRSRRAWVGRDGSFLLDGLQPTLHRLHVLPPIQTPGRDAWHVQRIAGGETAHIEIDARELRGCALTLGVFVNGSPESGVRTRLQPLEIGSWPCEIEATDEQGLACAWVATLGRARGELTSALGLPLGRVAIDRPLVLGATERRRLDVAATRFVVAWPADERFTTLTRVELNGSDVAGALSPFRVALDLLRPTPACPRGPTGDPSCDFGFVAPGNYELTLRLYSNHADVAAFRKRVSVPAGSRFVCVMARAESR